MKPALVPFAALLAASCAIGPAPPSQVHRVEFQAHGRRPIWELTIGDDRVVLRMSGGAERTWPRTPPRVDGHLRVWKSGEGANQITVEAWHDTNSGICNADRAAYVDHVEVRVDGRTLTGCGGELISALVTDQ